MRHRKRYPETTGPVERARVAQLRRAIPEIPEGWRSRPRHIQRLNDLSAEGVFSLGFSTLDGLKLAFVVLPPADRVQYSIGREGGVPSEEDVARVLCDWFDDKHVEVMPLLGALVYLRVRDLDS